MENFSVDFDDPVTIKYNDQPVEKLYINGALVWKNVKEKLVPALELTAYSDPGEGMGWYKSSWFCNTTFADQLAGVAMHITPTIDNWVYSNAFGGRWMYMSPSDTEQSMFFYIGTGETGSTNPIGWQWINKTECFPANSDGKTRLMTNQNADNSLTGPASWLQWNNPSDPAVGDADVYNFTETKWYRNVKFPEPAECIPSAFNKVSRLQTSDPQNVSSPGLLAGEDINFTFASWLGSFGWNPSHFTRHTANTTPRNYKVYTRAVSGGSSLKVTWSGLVVPNRWLNPTDYSKPSTVVKWKDPFGCYEGTFTGFVTNTNTYTAILDEVVEGADLPGDGGIPFAGPTNIPTSPPTEEVPSSPPTDHPPTTPPPPIPG